MQKHSLRLLKLLHQLSKRNGGTVNEQLVILGEKNLGRVRRQRKRRENVKTRMLKRRMNHDLFGSEVICMVFLFIIMQFYFLGCQVDESYFRNQLPALGP